VHDGGIPPLPGAAAILRGPAGAGLELRSPERGAARSGEERLGLTVFDAPTPIVGTNGSLGYPRRPAGPDGAN
jgi:hypothetical protein